MALQLIREDLKTENNITYKIEKYNATLNIYTSEKSLTTDEVLDAFVWYISHEMKEKDFKNSNIQIHLDNNRKEAKDISYHGFTELDENEVCTTWINPNLDKEKQLLTFFHEMVHVAYALEGIDDLSNEDEEIDAYEIENYLYNDYRMKKNENAK